MLEPGQNENPSLDSKAEAIRRIQKFKRVEGNFIEGDTFQFIERLCARTDLSSVVDPNTFRVPLTDTMSVGVQRVTVRESLANESNPEPKSKEVTIPVFHFHNEVGNVSVRFDGWDFHVPNSILNQMNDKTFRELYDGEDRKDYYKTIDEPLRREYLEPYAKRMAQDLPDVTREWDWRLLKFGLKGFVKGETGKVERLSRQEVVKRFIQAIDPITAEQTVASRTG